MGASGELIRSIAVGDQSVVEAVDAAMGRIEAGDADLNAVVVRDFDRARVRAARLDEERAAGRMGTLLGLPMTVKESFDVEGLVTTWGFEEHRGHVATRTARAVSRLEAEGAVILGKTNVPPGLMDFQSSNPVYGATHNPRGHGRSPGGSSGGSAAAVAAGFVTAELGSDIGGSIRIPSAFCGVWGLKPTFDVIPRVGHRIPGTDGHHDVLSVAGPIATSATDLDLLLRTMADHPLEPPVRRDLAGLRVAVMGEHPHAPIGSDVRTALDDIAGRFEERGARVDHDPSFPDLEAMGALYLQLLGAIMAARMPVPGVEPMGLDAWFALLDEHARIRRSWEACLADAHDLVLMPIFSRTAFPIDEDDVMTRVLDIDGAAVPAVTQLGWAGPATMSGMPSVAFPAGSGADGLPVGLQLMGPKFSDRELLNIADLITA